MTLYRQLVIFTLVLFFILFTGTWLAKLESTRSFLIDQLESHSQDTATSLGLSISQHNIENDMPAIEGMINAVFDRGYYRIVRYTDTNGNILIDRVLNISIENVPTISCSVLMKSSHSPFVTSIIVPVYFPELVFIPLRYHHL